MSEELAKERHSNPYSQETRKTKLTKVQIVVTNNVAGYIPKEHQSFQMPWGRSSLPTMSFITTAKQRYPSKGTKFSWCCRVPLTTTPSPLRVLQNPKLILDAVLKICRLFYMLQLFRVLECSFVHSFSCPGELSTSYTHLEPSLSLQENVKVGNRKSL